MKTEKFYAHRMERVKPSAIRELLKLGADPEVIAFGGGFPDPELFPAEKLAVVYEEVFRRHGRQALQYAGTEGLPSLRERVALRMRAAGIACAVEEVAIIQGAQQSMDLVAKMFINRDDAIVVERPTFLGAVVAFNPFEPKYLDVPMDNEGMRMDELERTLEENPGVKLVYTIPDFQNPTGRTMSLSRRERLMEIANRHDFIILEDSPYREIRFEGESLPPLKSMDTEGRVIHVGSFSKILCPGMRLGWMVADRGLIAKLCQLKMAADTQNSTLNMYAADTFLDRFDIDQHIRVLRQSYRKKKDLMLEIIGRTFPDCIGHSDPEGGLFTWLTMPDGADAASIMRERLLPEAKVAYVPGTDFFARDPRLNHARCNYSCMPAEKIVHGMTRMGEIFRQIFT